MPQAHGSMAVPAILPDIASLVSSGMVVDAIPQAIGEIFERE